MGVKGDKMSQDSVLSTELVLEKLSSIEGVSSKKMFGGHGLFHESKMFGIIDSKGFVFMKANESNMSVFEAAGSQQHSKMPYYSITEDIFNSKDQFLEVAKSSILASK